MSDQANHTSARSMLSDALTHVTNLVRGEVDLARAEITDNLKGAGAAIGMIVGGLALAIAALNILAGALVIALAETGLHPGWSALAVGLVFAAIAYGFTRKGIGDLSLSSLAPKRTARNLRRDAAALKESHHEQ